MDKRFLSILAVIVLIFVGIFVFTQNKNDDSNGGGGNSNAQPTSHTQGEGQKNVTFVEYGDFQCPVCSAYYQPIKEVVAKYSKDIKFQFRNLPLISIHPNAFAAARAAEAAGLQNKYFEMHGKLYENQSAWSESDVPLKIFQGYAQEIGLNMEQFNSDYASSKVNNAINADMKEFEKSKQQMATPAFFINGEFIANSRLSDPQTNAPSVDSISKVIDEYIAKSSNQ